MAGPAAPVIRRLAEDGLLQSSRGVRTRRDVPVEALKKVPAHSLTAGNVRASAAKYSTLPRPFKSLPVAKLTSNLERFHWFCQEDGGA